MKFLILLGLFFTYALAGDIEHLAKIDATRLSCIKERAATLGTKLLNIEKQHTVPRDDPDILGFFECLHKKLGLLKENGEIDLDAILQSLPVFVKSRTGKELDPKLLKEKCFSLQDDKPIIRALLIRDCGFKIALGA